MDLTTRQETLLNKIVSEYIKLARPVSSQLLEEEYDFDFSPATIRNEMLALSRAGFLEKPYASSGRVPSDKGYRFFVDELLQEGDGEHEPFDWENPFELARELTSFSEALTALYIPKEHTFLKEGWEFLLKEPEFQDQNTIGNFSKFVKDFEEYALKIPVGFGMSVFIGKENPFSTAKDFSIMIAECSLGNQKGFAALVGPKRMAYRKNIKALKSIHHGRRKIA